MTNELPLEVRLSILETLLTERQKQVDLQAKEYERRLNELNHSYEQQMQRNTDYVLRETWELRHDELMKQVQHHNGYDTEKFAEIDRWRARLLGVAVGVAVGAGIAGGGITALIMRLVQ